jgi:hypothetical protein
MFLLQILSGCGQLSGGIKNYRDGAGGRRCGSAAFFNLDFTTTTISSNAEQARYFWKSIVLLLLKTEN